ncbi:MAG: hypothetical protein WC223_10605 [Bacteroidales bacterium]|jgi:hypothetical protein
MSKLFEDEVEITPRPLNDKQLMNLYEIRHRQTWKKLLSPIAWKLVGRKKQKRYLYTKDEVSWIFEFLGKPVFFKKINND